MRFVWEKRNDQALELFIYIYASLPWSHKTHRCDIELSPASGGMVLQRARILICPASECPTWQEGIDCRLAKRRQGDYPINRQSFSDMYSVVRTCLLDSCLYINHRVKTVVGARCPRSWEKSRLRLDQSSELDTHIVVGARMQPVWQSLRGSEGRICDFL
ncbi:hypothetical protein EDD18DRAFT_1186609 [Armillaria luteobubalina]|uniref:Uncharacterized protein n=1 Tax=Armillaria luteobubalina TaxID=153913 RepID=A0AA39UHW3_9AGAR|nr:hypothetical protein EDD18DRAFT_1186609 [Armillaria luteobubalina]